MTAETSPAATEFVLFLERQELRFTGWLLASLTSNDGSAEKVANHTDLDVYRTTEGRFVAVRRTTNRGDVVYHKAHVCTSRRAAQDWLGFGALSCELYEELRWPL